MMGRIAMVAWYGYSYSPGSVHDRDSIEYFDSIKAAADMFAARIEGDTRFPCVDADVARAHLYRVYREDGDISNEYPNYVVTIGPRGGAQVTRF